MGGSPGGDRPDLKERILAAAEVYNRSSGMPFTVDFSIGTVLAKKNQKRPLDECVREADALMYEIKTERKVGR